MVSRPTTQKKLTSPRGLLLDRDGVICKYLNKYLLRLEEFQFLDGIEDLLCQAKNKNFIVVVVTNQPQVGKKLLLEKDLHQIHHLMTSRLNGLIDQVYFCPHLAEDNCSCRKPLPGMILEAQKDFNLDLSSSIMIGDSVADIKAGREVGCRTIFIKNEYNQEKLERCQPHHVVEKLTEAILLLD